MRAHVSLALSVLLLAFSSGCGSSGGTSSGGGSSLPPPAGLVATPRYGYVDLSWDAVPGVEDYVVYVASVPDVGAHNYWLVANGEKRIVRSATTATFGEYPGSSRRHLRVATLVGSTEGVLSTDAVTTLPPDPPAYLLAQAGVGEVEVRLGGSSGASTYEIFLAASEEVTSANWASLPEGRSEVVPLVHRVTGLVNGRAYYFVARATNASGPSRDSVRAQATPSVRGSFGPSTAFPVGNGPAAVATADFDRDGRADVVTANSASSTVSLLRGDGAGALLPRTDHAVGATPLGVVAADFSGDGLADVVTANADAGTVSVLLGDGLGGLSPATNFPAGTRPVALTVADFDRDGKLDLAVADATGGSMRFLRALGAGAFAPPTAFAVGTGPTSISAGDFDADGAVDVAVSSASAGGVTAWFGNGLGAFSRRTDLPVGADCRSLAVGEWDGNGLSDIVALAVGDQVMSLFLANATGGFFPGIQLFTPAGGTTLVTSADLDGDFRPDLLLANAPTSSLSVLLARPGPSFLHVIDHPTSPLPTAVATVDLDGDGVLDAVVTHSAMATVSVLLGRS